MAGRMPPHCDTVPMGLLPCNLPVRVPESIRQATPAVPPGVRNHNQPLSTQRPL